MALPKSKLKQKTKRKSGKGFRKVTLWAQEPASKHKGLSSIFSDSQDRERLNFDKALLTSMRALRHTCAHPVPKETKK